MSLTPENKPPIHPIRWNATTKVVIAVLLFVLAALALYAFRVVIVPLAIGAVLAYVMTPLVRRMTAKGRMPRGLATALVYLVLLLVVAPLPASLIPWVVRQVSLLQRELIQFLSYLNEISGSTVAIMGVEIIVGDIVTEVTSGITSMIASAAPASVTLVFGAAETLLMVIFTLLFAFYLTRDAPSVKAWFTGLVPETYQHDVHILGKEIDLIWGAFLRGQIILVMVVGLLLTAIGSLIGLPQPVLLGAMGGLLEILPSVGHAIWLVTASVLALVEGSSTLPISNLAFLVVVIIAHTAYTQFDLNYLIPRIIGRRVHLHPMIVILGIIVGAAAGNILGGGLGSVLGVALAAPVIASLRVLGRYVYARLFDLDPFPMVGPPSAPPEIREEEAAAEPVVEPVQVKELRAPFDRLIERVRRWRKPPRSEP